MLVQRWSDYNKLHHEALWRCNRRDYWTAVVVGKLEKSGSRWGFSFSIPNFVDFLAMNQRASIDAPPIGGFDIVACFDRCGKRLDAIFRDSWLRITWRVPATKTGLAPHEADFRQGGPRLMTSVLGRPLLPVLTAQNETFGCRSTAAKEL